MSNIAHAVNLGKMNVGSKPKVVYTFNGGKYAFNEGTTENEARIKLVAKGVLKPLRGGERGERGGCPSICYWFLRQNRQRSICE
jgi:hypothetical protein